MDGAGRSIMGTAKFQEDDGSDSGPGDVAVRHTGLLLQEKDDSFPPNGGGGQSVEMPAPADAPISVQAFPADTASLSAPDQNPQPLNIGGAGGTLDDEVTFISGLNPDGTLARYAFGALNYDDDGKIINPADYSGPYTFAGKWGATTAGTPGGTVSYYFNPASSWTATEKQAFVSGLALWSAEADISFSETGDAGAAQITFTRGGDKKAATSPHYTDPAGNGGLIDHLNLLQLGSATISIDTSAVGSGFGPIGGSLSTSGGYPWTTLIHEEGHAIGLGHAGPYNGTVDPATQQFSPYDTRLWSLMSYLNNTGSNEYPAVNGASWNGEYPTTPMIADILAAQRLYGTPASTPLSGGQVFGFNTNIGGDLQPFFDFTVNTKPVITIWDAGSGNTLDLSGFSSGSTVNLNAGTFSSCAGMFDNLAIAPGTAIDRLILGSGYDTVTCNDDGDYVDAGNGNNILTGGAGNDTFVAGGASDIIYGGAGTDTVIFNANLSNYSVSYGTDGHVFVRQASNFGILNTLQTVEFLQFADQGIDAASENVVFGGTGSDTLAASAGNDYLNGAGGFDYASYADAAAGVTVSLAINVNPQGTGGSGSDTLTNIEGLIGSAHDDTLTGGSGNDTLDGGDGDDTLDGGDGTNTLDGMDGFDTVVYSGARAGYSIVHGSGGSVTISGGGRTDTLTGMERARFSDISVLLGEPEMPTTAQAEATFISGIGSDGKIAAGTFQSWTAGSNPATYDATNSSTTKWATTDSPAPGSAGGTVTYYFDPASAWTDTEKAMFRASFSLWAAEANISFVENTGTPDPATQVKIERGASGTGAVGGPHATGTVGAGKIGGSNLWRADYGSIRIATAEYGPLDGSFSTRGGGAWQTVEHEIGHVLGLGHGGPYDAAVNTATQQYSEYDSTAWTIMSYISPIDTGAKYYGAYPVSGFAWGTSPAPGGGYYDNTSTTPMAVDILAIQQLYGAPTSGQLTTGQRFGFNTTLTGDIKNFFDFSVNTKPVVTLYDSGTNNILDLSGYAMAETVNLNPGTFSAIGGLTNNVCIAYGTAINTYYGCASGDTVICNANGDRIYTNDGTDTVWSGTGNDTIDGGNGTDSVVYFANRAGFTVVAVGGNYQVTGSGYGTDTLSNVENLTFNDGTFAIGSLAASIARTSDFNGDGKSDILWRNSGTGTAEEWLMNGGSISSAPDIATVAPADGWSILGRADFNGDGKSDIVWRNPASGTLQLWLMNGGTISSSGNPGTVAPASGWAIAGTGDFNGDGKADLLWRDSATGKVQMWLMNGATPTSSPDVATIAPSDGWSIAGTGDFNGDGRSDILWHNPTSGAVQVWLMNGSSVASSGNTATISPGSGWNIAATGDFDGDGKSDLLWQNNFTGTVQAWFMNGTGYSAATNIATVAPADGWSIAETGDYNGDGKSDILWRNPTSGALQEWLMNGGSVSSSPSLTSIPPGSGWSIMRGGGFGPAARNDFNGDGRGDILWQNSGSGTVEEWQMNGGSSLSSPDIATIAPGSGWSVVAGGDFDANGKADLLWRNSNTGTIQLWLMNGGTIASASNVGSVSPASGWSVVGAGDFNGDGRSDILWQNSTTGTVEEWLMNGSAVLSAPDIATVAPGSGWSIAATGDFDADGKSDILWRNSSTGTVQAWLMNGSAVSSSSNVGAVAPASGWSIIGAGDFNGDGRSDVLWQNANTGTVEEWLMNGGATLSTPDIATVTPGSGWSLAGTADYNADGKTDLLWRNSSSGTVQQWLMNGAAISSSSNIATIAPASGWNILAVAGA
jgi:hypothetical protein